MKIFNKRELININILFPAKKGGVGIWI